MNVCGPAVTARCHPGDNIMLQLAISVAGPGDVLVVATGESSEQGSFGEVLTTWCMARGIAGLVTDGGVRDGLAIRNKGFPVFCPGLCVKGTVKETLGSVNHPIVIGGIAVEPGDIVCADDDGVVIVRRDEALQIAADAEAREQNEARLMKSLEEGADLLKIVGMDAIAAAKGCTYDT
jgi:4-hydroxy-4-methyl-2-oxoglutarate aldolase